MLKKPYILFIISFILITNSYSQELTKDDSRGILYRIERTGGALIHTDGWGIIYRQGKHITGFKKRMYEFEFVNMKHPKEMRTSNESYSNSKSFIYGKTNNFFILRTGIGLQRIINGKSNPTNVEIRYLLFGGLSMGMTKPVYLYILDNNNMPTEDTFIIEKYDPSKHNSNNIIGRAPFLRGMEEMKFHPGLYSKFGINFEYSSEGGRIKSLEVGAIVDAYPKTIDIMAFAKNKNIFLSFYLSFHLGVKKN
ncbi:MAG: hypothetical protein WC223_07380 [Bacteroidales bacterium]|jgi:hypothetical protein